MKTLLVPLLFAGVISFIATPIIIKIAPLIGAMDIPKDERRVHSKPMPLLGGVAMYIATMAAILFFLPLTKTLISIIIGGTIIFLSGLKDDLKGTTPKEKMFYQLLASVIVVWGGVQVDFITNPFESSGTILYLSWIGIPITIFWIVGITNTLNLIDGLDGLAAGVALISSISFVLVASKFGSTSIGILAAIIAGATIGFLPFNFNPAKIFMGDTGALFLGFMLAIVSIEGVMKSVATIAMIVPIIILGVPIFDTTFAIFRRLLSGKNIMAADKSHLHHRLLNKGFSQKQTVLILYGISAVFGLFAVLVSKANSTQAVYLSVILFVIAIIFALKMGLFSSANNKEDHE